MLQNFTIKVPEIEVILPQSEKKYRVRSLKLDEEYNIKSSMISTPSVINQKLNEIIYGTITDKNKPDFKTFLSQVSVKDRDALMYGLYEITYGDEYPIENYACPKCNKIQPIKINLSSGFNNVVFKAKDIKEKIIEKNENGEEVTKMITKKETPLMEKTVEVKLDDNLYAIVHQSSLAYEQLILDKIHNESVESLMQKVKMFKITKGKSEEIYSLYDSEADYVYIFKQLYRKHKTIIEDAYNKTFGKYGTKVTTEYTCKNCGNVHKFDVDFVQQFFLMVYQS